MHTSQLWINPLENDFKSTKIWYDEVAPNPTIKNVQAAVEFSKETEVDCIIAIGGGLSINLAKAVGIILNNPDFLDVRSLEGVADTELPSLPILVVPTTSGTAAKVIINYVIMDEEISQNIISHPT